MVRLCLKRLILTILALALLVLACPAWGAAESSHDAVILFTHDTHDHFYPAPSEDGGEYGGYTRLATLLERERVKYPDAITVDGGDFSMGTLFQTIYATQAPELKALGAMGYDVTTLGNHEFDYRASGLAQMLETAASSGSPVPAIVQSNGTVLDGTGSQELKQAMENYGVENHLIITRGGVNYGIFGLMGEDADACAPMSGMEFEPVADAARREVAALEEELAQLEGPSLIVCLSHTGTDGGKGEDYELAKAVDGIDVIISGHTHSTLEQPIEVNGTLIVSCGEYTTNLGVLELKLDDAGAVTDYNYRLVPVDETVKENTKLERLAQSFQPMVEKEYLSAFGLTFDQVLARSDFDFTPISQFGKEHREDTLGNLIADSYIYAVQQAEGEDYVPVDFAVVAAGVIRESFSAGDITTSDVFNVSSLGSGADGSPGYPLISVWITGRELKDAFEVDASVTSLMPAAQIYGSGMTWTWNSHRMILNRVNDCAQVLPDGTTVPLEDDKLYRVVTGLYTGQMLGTVNDQSFGILTITPKDAQGNEVTNFEDQIIYNSNGSELKEWYALATYLQSMGTVDERYAAPEGRKVEDASWNPVSLLKGMNLIGGIALVVVLLVIALVVFLVYRLVLRRGRRYGGRRGRGYCRYRG